MPAYFGLGGGGGGRCACHVLLMAASAEQMPAERGD